MKIRFLGADKKFLKVCRHPLKFVPSIKHKIMTEDQFCAKAVQYIWNTYPQTRRLLQHIPNEAKRSKIEWVQLKAKGLTPGATDYIFFWNGMCHAIEAKDPNKGIVSKDQLLVHEALKSQNIPVHFVYSDKEFINLIESIINVHP